MPESDSNQLSHMHQQLSEHFNLEEVRTLCLHLGIDYDDLGGEGKSGKIRELILLMDRKGRWPDLLAEVKVTQPQNSSIQNLLPPHHIPYRRNVLFTGRKEWLAQLHDALYRDEPVAVTQAVAGLGGVGKTQLALAYCYRHLEDYDLIQWLRADDTTTLGTALAELAYRLGLARREVTDQPTLHQLALNWLQTTDKRWLLVYDNADAIQLNELRPFLPKLGHGACLITSRNPNWGTLAQTLNLTHFSDGEAVAFLLGKPTMIDEEFAAHPQGKGAQKLAHLLGNLPLALEHARAYVEETGCSLADYADYFENEREELWADTPPPANYDQKTITTTWELAFAQARQTPGAAALLNLCCFLAPDEIPLDLIMTAVGADDALPLPEELVALANSKLKLDKAIAALRRFSLLTRDGDTISLHRLVQTVARDQMPSEIKQTWAEATLLLLKNTFSYWRNDMATWENSRTLLPHVTVAIQFGLQEKVARADVATLLNHTGQFLDDYGQYSLARNNYEQALAIREEILGLEHIDTVVCLNNLGNLLRSLGAYEAARPYLERALAIFEKNLGADDPNVATLNNNLGQLLEAVGEYEAARPYMERALEIWEKVLGADHPQVAIGNNNLAALLIVVGEYEAARPYMDRALAIDEKALGPNHPDVGRDLNNLGQLLEAVGEYESALLYLERALAIWEAKLGPDHPHTNIVRGNLAALLAEMEGKS